MQKIAVGELLAQSNGSQFVLTLDNEEIPSLYPGEENLVISGILTLIRVRDGINLLGNVDVTQKVPCTSCLTDIEAAWHTKFDQLFSLQGGLEVEPIKDSAINLAKPLSEAVLAAKPIILKCREDCKGLCQRCGANLNDNPDHTHS